MPWTTHPMNSVAFNTLVSQHLKLIHKVSVAYCKTAADRDDVVQEVLAQLWRSRGTYDPKLRASTWIYRVALNVAISFYRRERRHTEPRRADEQALISLPAAPEVEPGEDVQVLQGCIAELDELNRALVLLYLDGNEHEAIAEVLGITVSNVGTKLGRLKQTLKRCIELHSDTEN